MECDDRTSSLVMRIIIENMDRRIFHGNITPSDLAHALMAEYNRGNMQAQVMGTKEKLAVQIATRRGSQSGGHTALTIGIQAVEDGIMVEIGQQEWLGVAASIGQTAFSALRNPMNLLHRLDDIARITCEYCESANPVGEGNCCACGAPLGSAYPTTCHRCGFTVSPEENTCPNCRQKLK